MTGTLVIGSRFCGPPDSGNGGYVCGLIADYLDGPAEVTLRKPPPLETALNLERDGHGSVRVRDGQTLIAEAISSPKGPALQLPDPVSVQQARSAGARSHLRVHPGLHPFPTCFVCGPDRRPGDGLRILVGPVAGRKLSADLWYPAAELSTANGYVRTEFMWAALDCAGGVGAIGDAVKGGAPFLLGRLSARQIGEVKAGEPHVVIGWRLAAQGRKIVAGSALFAASGQPVAVTQRSSARYRHWPFRCCSSPLTGTRLPLSGRVRWWRPRSRSRPRAGEHRWPRSARGSAHRP